jgi:hypothetical protein
VGRLLGKPLLLLAMSMSAIAAQSQTQLDIYAGRYAVMPNFILVIAREGDHLSVQSERLAKFEVFPKSDTEFVSKAGGIGLKFKVDAQGRSTGLTLHQAGTDLLAPRVEGQPEEKSTTAPRQRKAIALDPKRFDACCDGRYRLSTDFVLTVFREGSRFFAQGTGQSKYEIFPESATQYFVKEEDVQMTFELDDHGKATAITVHQLGMNLHGEIVTRTPSDPEPAR